jgi:hypothetical protein
MNNPFLDFIEKMGAVDDNDLYLDIDETMKNRMIEKIEAGYKPARLGRPITAE